MDDFPIPMPQDKWWNLYEQAQAADAFGVRDRVMATNSYQEYIGAYHGLDRNPEVMGHGPGYTGNGMQAAVVKPPERGDADRERLAGIANAIQDGAKVPYDGVRGDVEGMVDRARSLRETARKAGHPTWQRKAVAQPILDALRDIIEEQ